MMTFKYQANYVTRHVQDFCIKAILNITPIKSKMSQHHIIIMKSKLDEKMLLKVLSENGSFEFALIHVHVSCLLFVRKIRYEDFYLFIFILGIGGVSEQILQSSSKISFLCRRTLNEISKYIEGDNAYMTCKNHHFSSLKSKFIKKVLNID